MGFVSASQVTIGYAAASREDALHYLSEQAVELGFADDASAVEAAFIARENEAETGLVAGFAVPHAKSDAIDPPADSEPCPADTLLDFFPPLPSDFFSFESFFESLSEDSEASLESDSSESFDPSFALSEDLESLDATLPEAVVEPETDASLATMLSPVTVSTIQSMDQAPLTEG